MLRTVTVSGRKYAVFNVAFTIDTDSEFFHLAEPLCAALQHHRGKWRSAPASRSA